MFAKLFALILTGFLDRIRGDSFDFAGKSVEAILYGGAVAICFDSDVLWTLPVFAVLWLVGSCFGWGCPMGAVVDNRPMDSKKFHWWQFGAFKKNVWMALTLRGFIWGVPPALLCFVDIRYAACLIMTVIFPLAVYICRNWEKQELIRGWMIGLVAFVVGETI